MGIIMLLSSCSSSNSTNSPQEFSGGLTKSQEEFNVSNTDLKQLVNDGLLQRLNRKIDKKDLKLDYPYYEDNAIFSTFYTTVDQEIELGIIYAEWVEDRYKLQFIDLFPVDNSKPFSVVSTSGKMLGDKREFKAYFGYIFDKSINEIRINYDDNITNSVKLKSDNKTFLDVTTGKEIVEKSIEGRNSEDDVIYNYNY
jgi:hypothetical protein